MLRKIALAVGGVVIVGIIIMVIIESLGDGGYLTAFWDWMFKTALGLDNPPPSPFGIVIPSIKTL